MSKVQMLRASVKQRLTAAAEEIFGLFERTIAEYEEQLCRSTEENERHRKLLDAVFKPQLRLHRAEARGTRRAQRARDVSSSPGIRDSDGRSRAERPRDAGHRLDVRQLSASEEQVPEVPRLDQEEPPELPRIKEEEEELWSSQEEEQLRGPEEVDVTEFTLAAVKSEEDDEEEEKPQSSQLHHRQTEQMETDADGDDCGGPGPAGNSDPERHLTPDAEDKTEDSSEPETKVSDDDKNREAHLDLNSLKNNVFSSQEKPFSCFDCGKQFNKNSKLKVHTRIHTGEKPFSCSLCGKRFTQKTGLDHHLKTHTGERPFSCSVCGKRFGQKAYLQKHLKCHTGEKPYHCSLCNKCFSRCEHLQSHMRTHTGEKPFNCSICDKRFTWRCQLKNHKCGGESSQLHELWTNQEGEQLPGLEEADIIKFTFTPVSVKSEDDDEERPQTSQLHHR